MKKILLLALSVVGVITLTFAQDKLLEKSGKQPKWVNGLEKDFIIVTGTGPTAQDAQQNALSNVKAQIVSSVAENVKASSEVRKEEASFNNNVNAFLESLPPLPPLNQVKYLFCKGFLSPRLVSFTGKNGNVPTSRFISYTI